MHKLPTVLIISIFFTAGLNSYSSNLTPGYSSTEGLKRGIKMPIFHDHQSESGNSNGIFQEFRKGDIEMPRGGGDTPPVPCDPKTKDHPKKQSGNFSLGSDSKQKKNRFFLKDQFLPRVCLEQNRLISPCERRPSVLDKYFSKEDLFEDNSLKRGGHSFRFFKEGRFNDSNKEFLEKDSFEDNSLKSGGNSIQFFKEDRSTIEMPAGGGNNPPVPCDPKGGSR